MTTEATPETPSTLEKSGKLPNQPPKRPWWRLHRSTWAVVALMAILLTTISYPGMYDQKAPQHISIWSGYVHGSIIVYPQNHGWPWRFLRRCNTDRSTLLKNSDIHWDFPPWLMPQCWSCRGNWSEVSILNLLLDMLVGIFIIGFVGFYFERRRRGGLRLWQFTLREIIALTLLIALGLSYWTSHRQRLAREFKTINKKTASLERDFVCFDILTRLLGPGLLSDFRAGIELVMYGKEAVSPQSIIYHLHALPYLEVFSINEDIEIDQEVIDALKQCPRLKRLSLTLPVKPVSLKTLAFLPRLEVLEIQCESLSEANADELGSLINLRKLRLSAPILNKKQLSHIARLRNLKSLDVSADLVEGGDIDWLFALRNAPLESLNLSLHSLNDVDVRSVASLRDLSYLRLCFSTKENIDVCWLESLIPLSKLESLNLIFPAEKSSYFRNIGKLTNIDWLTLEGLALDDSDVDWLGAMKKLFIVDIRDAAMTSKGIKKLQKLLPECSITSDFPDAIEEDNDDEDSKSP